MSDDGTDDLRPEYTRSGVRSCTLVDAITATNTDAPVGGGGGNGADTNRATAG
ncbi:MAG: hypothetical protein ACREXW_10000 [Gammaproteobacteria bacterium]